MIRIEFKTINIKKNAKRFLSIKDNAPVQLNKPWYDAIVGLCDTIDDLEDKNKELLEALQEIVGDEGEWDINEECYKSTITARKAISKALD